MSNQAPPSTIVELSSRQQTARVLLDELEKIEIEQIEIAGKMSALILHQTILAKKSKALHDKLRITFVNV